MTPAAPYHPAVVFLGARSALSVPAAIVRHFELKFGLVISPMMPGHHMAHMNAQVP